MAACILPGCAPRPASGIFSISVGICLLLAHGLSATTSCLSGHATRTGSSATRASSLLQAALQESIVLRTRVILCSKQIREHACMLPASSMLLVSLSGMINMSLPFLKSLCHLCTQGAGWPQAASASSSGALLSSPDLGCSIASHAEAVPGSCEAALKAFNKAAAELGRLVKAGAVNLTADAAAGAPFKLDVAALAVQPCRPQACHLRQWPQGLHHILLDSVHTFLPSKALSRRACRRCLKVLCVHTIGISQLKFASMLSPAEGLGFIGPPQLRACTPPCTRTQALAPCCVTDRPGAIRGGEGRGRGVAPLLRCWAHDLF